MKKWMLLAGCGALAATGIVLGLWLGSAGDSEPPVVSVAEPPPVVSVAEPPPAVSVAEPPPAVSVAEPPPAVGVAEPLYDETFDSLEEMLALDDTVAIVGRTTTAFSSEPIGDGVLFTERVVLVDQVLHGTLADPEAKRIKVRQTGGTIGRETLKVEHARLLVDNEHVVLVLHYDSEIDVYWIKGGGDGHFLIDGAGLLRHANYDGTDHPLAAFARDVGAKPLRSVFAENAPD